MAGRSVFCLIVLAALAVPVQSLTFSQQYAADTSYIYTGTDYVYTNFLYINRNKFITFGLRACSDGHIILAEHEQVLTFKATEIVIGGWTNTKSVMRESTQGSWLTEADTPNILHCAEYRSFWISWDWGLVEVGRGTQYGVQTFMSMDRSSHMHDIYVIAISTGYTYPGTWQLSENQGLYLGLYSPRTETYELIWKTVARRGTFYTFFVAACSDVNIMLGTSMGVYDYNIVIGGWDNSKSVVRRRETQVVEAETEGVLNCEESRPLWVSWYKGNIQVGKGTLKGQPFLDWTDPTPFTIEAIGFSTASGHTGYFLFNEGLENVFTFLNTPVAGETQVDYFNWIVAPTASELGFEATGCTDAYVILRHAPMSPLWDNPDDVLDEDTVVYIVYFGVNGNSRSGIKRSFNEAPLVEVSTHSIMDCFAPVPLWISWLNKTITVGIGLRVGSLALFSYKYSDSGRISAVGFGGYTHLQLQYDIRALYGKQTVMYTPFLGPEDTRTWVTTRGEVFKTFQVETCIQSVVEISQFPGDVFAENWKIVLAYENSANKVAIMRTKNGTTEVHTRDRIGLVSCMELESFWVSWHEQYLRLGTGMRFMQGELLRIHDGDLYPINALGLRVDSLMAQWAFETDPGDYVLIHNRNTKNNYQWVKLHTYLNWLTMRVTGVPAMFALTSEYMNSKDAFVITLGADSNTRVTIVQNGKELASYESDTILKTNRTNDFWVSFDNDQISVGSGRIRSIDAWIDSYSDDQYTKDLDINALGFKGTTTEQLNSNEWEFLYSYGIEMYAETYSSTFFSQTWLSVGHRDHIFFDVKACSDARIILSAVMHFQSKRESYIIGISWEDVTTITNYDIVRASNSTSNLLSCGGERYFWLSWHNGHIVLGSGTEMWTNQIVSWHDVNPFTVAALGITTNVEGSDGSWRFPLLDVEPGHFPKRPVSPDGGLSGGAIAGIVIGCLLAVVIIAAIVFVVIKGVPEPMRAMMPSRTSSATSTPGQSSFDNPVHFEAPSGGTY